jgi:ABC-2 type transport system permease protein
MALTGVYVGQIAVVALAVLVMTAEYDGRTMITTLAAAPRRWGVLAAKATVVTTVTVATGAPAVSGCRLTGQIVLRRNGFTATNGYPSLLSLGDEPVRRAFLGTIAYLAIIALFSLGVATILRSSAGALTTVLSLLYVVPIAARFVTDPDWQHALMRYSPMTAGLTVQSTHALDQAPIGPWAGLGVAGAYASAAMLVGSILFQARDA